MPNQYSPKRPVIIPVGPSIAYIELTKGQYSLIDSWNIDEVQEWNWCAMDTKSSRTIYAGRHIKIPKTRKSICIKLHCLVLPPDKGLMIDHINGNGLDNRRSNLRMCTHAQNKQNVAMTSFNTTGFKGIAWNKNLQRWHAKIQVNGVNHSLKYHYTKEAAHAAYCEAAKRLHGEFARFS
jgi:hypothetical protein